MSFSHYLKEAEVNSHMTHLSDLVFIGGVDGSRKAVKYLSDLRNMFGHAQKNVYTVKFDGAPAIICGIDPTDGEFFVAKKGIFNKTPKVYKTKADIAADLSGELADKFTTLLKYLPELGISSGIYQGDLMYTADDLKFDTIDGQDVVIFHPNTIAYAVPRDSDLGKSILKSKLGIVFHTTYTGRSFDTLKANFGKNIVNRFSKSANVWAIDATLDNQTANFTLTDAEYVQSEFLLKDIGVQFQRIPSELLNKISKDETLQSLVLIYINSLVRKNVKDITSLEMSTGFFQFIHARYQKEIDSKKTEKSKSALTDKRTQALSLFMVYTHAQIAAIFELAKSIDLLKDMLLKKMRKINGLSHFIKTANGFRVTNPEGFVAINSTSGDAIKLVDRFEFSQANFDPNVIKGWVK
jgi:Family of unknown function (DUF6267)